MFAFYYFQRLPTVFLDGIPTADKLHRGRDERHSEHGRRSDGGTNEHRGEEAGHVESVGGRQEVKDFLSTQMIKSSTTTLTTEFVSEYLCAKS